MALTSFKCPECAAKLTPTPGATQVRCEYCGAASRIGRAPQAPSDGHLPAAVPAAGSARLMVALTAAGVVIAGVVVALTVSAPSPTSTATSGVAAAAAGEPAEPAPIRAVLTGAHRGGCLVDANGDEALDVAGVFAWSDDRERYLVSIIDGATGERLWAGPEVPRQSSLLCARDDRHFAVATPDFKVQLHGVGRAEPVILQLTDELHNYRVGEGCFALALKNEEVRQLGFAGDEVETCAGSRAYRSYDGWGSKSMSAATAFGDEYNRTFNHRAQLWLGVQDGVTYVALTSYPGTPFITVTAKRGDVRAELEAFESQEGRWDKAASGRELYEAVEALDAIWSVEPSLTGDSFHEFVAVLTPRTLVLYGEAPGSAEKSYQMVGLGLERGTVRYTKTLSTDMFSLQYNGRYVLADGRGDNFAFDPDTGERAWTF
jgi:DNA-directed RNA polymerase subunit RPC12/RpoP